MKSILKTTALLLVLAIGLTISCKEKPEKEEPKEETYPLTIQTTLFSLLDGCAWNNLTPDLLYLINSHEELAQHLTCYTGTTLEIDFNRYSLIVLAPKNCNIDSKVEKTLLQQQSVNRYSLSVDVISTETANTAPLVISLLAPKLANNAQMEFAITYTYIEPPCNCIMDTLKGEWSWVKWDRGGAAGGVTDNEFKLVIKILSQNNDGAINYEVFVEDTLFYRGDFQIQEDQHGRNLANIILPHTSNATTWYIFFHNPLELEFNEERGRFEYKPTKNALTFYCFGIVSPPWALYERIK